MVKENIDDRTLKRLELGKVRVVSDILRDIPPLHGCMSSEPHGEGGYRGELWKKLELGEK